MHITFHGAARMVTGSKHLIELDNGKKILLDCGLFQGMGEQTLSLNQHFGFNPREIDVVLLSHAHIDHSGLLPKLIREGFRGQIYCTPATADLTEVLLLDSAEIQEADVHFVNARRAEQDLPAIEPLYTIEDVQRVIPHLQEVPYGVTYKLDDDVSFHFTDTGHILGSAAIHVKVREHGKEQVIMFSGDVGRYRDVILRTPETFPQADYILIESTYGDSRHDDYENTEEALLAAIRDTCLRNHGKLVIPAFSVGRTQELLFALNKLENQGRLPPLEYFVDSPLSTKITEIVRKHAELFNEKVVDLMKTDNYPFDFKGLHFITEANESKYLNHRKEPMVIISASGMAEAGRVKHHIANTIENPRNHILMVGFCEYHTLGARLLRGEKHVKIFRREYEVKAGVSGIRSMSAHGDYEDLLHFLSCQQADQVKEVFLVHGEYEVQEVFSKKLQEAGFKRISIPEQHETRQLKP